MESYKIENLSFTYPEREYKSLDRINVTVNQGEFITLCGKSGCGKTTLLRLLKSSLAPFGDICGDIYFESRKLTDINTKEQASKIGFVMQSPDNQIVTDKVWHELAFGLESLGISTSEIRAKVAEMASFFGIENWFYKKTNELSGGQKQILNLASVMVMQPSVLILDEPTSQLDPICASNFLKTLEKINRELGTTVILSEHRLEEAFEMSDRVLVMDSGKIIADDTPKNIGTILKRLNHDMESALPTPVRVYNAVENNLECPLTVREGRDWLRQFSRNTTLRDDLIPTDKQESVLEETQVELKDVWFRYEKDLPDVIKGLNVKINKGEIFAVVGGNGSGKTTALSLISGLNKAYRGDVFIKGEKIEKIKNLYDGVLGVLPQNPQSMFLKKTVHLDLLEMLEDKKISDEEKEMQIKKVSSLCQLDDLQKSHPYDLSGGEQQRAALAKVLLKSPEILLLDEPTKGLDAHFKKTFAYILNSLKSKGVTIIIVSHDVEFCAEYADRCAMLFDGNITSIDKPREFFAGKNFYTTAANRMARTYLPKAVLSGDIIKACGGNITIKEKKTYNIENKEIIKKEEAKEKKESKEPKPNKKLAKRTVTMAFLILIAIPLTIYLGMRFFGERKYYLISFLIIIETIIPFCMVFESRKPKARELILISVLCAITVCSRTVFFSLQQFKPVVALIIISGVCFGAETGFLVGAVTAFVSNMFFGQGPWTIWQMFALGIIGFLAGILFKKGLIQKTRLSLCVFGFIATFIIYGGIMNPASVIMWQNNITKKMIISAYVAGIPFDLIHSVSSAFFLWFISKPMIEKLDRIKLKYGLIDG